VIVGSFVIGMLLTPPDVISQIMLAIPMWLLFELGLIFSGLFKVRIKEASDAREEMNAEKTSAVAGATALSADKLWEDDDYLYEDEAGDPDDFTNRSIHNEYTDDDAFDTGGTPESKDDGDNESEDTLEQSHLDQDAEEPATADDKFFDNPDFEELSEEEMEAELDRIEAEEIAEKIVEDKAKKRAQSKSDKDKKDNA
jgi:sec-independent protein translocase protein TatC